MEAVNKRLRNLRWSFFLFLFFGASLPSRTFAQEPLLVQIPSVTYYLVGTEEEASRFVFSPFYFPNSLIYLPNDDTEKNKIILEKSDEVFVFPRKKVLVEGEWSGYVNSPYIRFLPGSKLYPYVAWKENWSLKRAKTKKDKFNLNLLYAAKRIAELENILKNPREEQFLVETLKKHQNFLQQGFAYLKLGWEEEPKEFIEEVLKMEAYVKDFKKKLSEVLVRKESFEQAQKVFSLDEEILNWVGKLKNVSGSGTYYFPVPKDGKYFLLMKAESEVYKANFSWLKSVFIGSRPITKFAEYDEGWQISGPFALRKGYTDLTLSLPPKEAQKGSYQVTEDFKIELLKEGEFMLVSGINAFGRDITQKINFKKIDFNYQILDPFEFVVNMKDKPSSMFFLVFNRPYNQKQSLYLNFACGKNDLICKAFGSFGMNSLDKKYHFIANGFGNGWLIEPERLNDGKLTIELWYQRVYYLGLILIIILFLTWILSLILKYLQKDRLNL